MKETFNKKIYLSLQWTFSTSVCRCALQRVLLFKRAFALIILPLERGKFQYCKDDDSKAHAWDYCTLTKGNNIPLCVGYCLLFGSRYCRTSDKTTFNSSHAFSFTQVLTAYFWETVSSKKVVYEYP